MKAMKHLTLAALAIISSASAYAANGIELGYPSSGGNGCPAGSVSASVAPDGSSLSILFDSFIAQAGGSTGLRLDRKSCNIAIPVRIPAGFSVSVLQVDYRGFNDVPAGARAQLSAEYFLAGSRGPRFVQEIRGPVSQDFLFQNPMIATAWTDCGADTILRVNAATLVQTNSRNQEVTSIVDSADVSSGIIYHLQWRSCR